MPATSWRPSAAIAASLPVHQSSGACSDQPGTGLREAVVALGPRHDGPVGRHRERLDAGRADVETDRDCACHRLARSGRAERGVDELVGPDGVLARLRLAQRGVVDAPGHRVDEVPLVDAARRRRRRRPRCRGRGRSRGARRSRRSSARRSSSASSSVSMNAVAPTMLSSSNVPQPEFACWCPSRPSAGEHGGVLAQRLAVHDQVLPVHVDLDVRRSPGRAACG